ncbi:MAG: hypothetical protein PHI05_00590 [Bacilli bacterium]|nr:hypothetical protein [Bacilli bacterium]MDD4547238.1 hypothetical protein [Bacilli bacterium]
MYTKIKDNNKIIISHIADIDGMGAVCLANAVFKDIDVILVEVSELKDALELVKDKNYSTVFITDLPIRQDSINLINNNETLKERIVHFDHHSSELSNNDYSFINVVTIKNGINTCGTSLFYDYLKTVHKTPLLDKDYTKEFVELVRSYDTYDWKKEKNIAARDLTTLFTVVGHKEFIDKYSYELLTNENHFNFYKNDRFLIDAKDKEVENYINLCDEKLIRINLYGNDIGVSISENYRSEVGNYLSEKYKDELKFILIVNFMRNSFSFRTVRDDVNLGEFAKRITPLAGGQEKAAGMPINSETVWILEKINQTLVNGLEKEKTLVKTANK